MYDRCIDLQTVCQFSGGNYGAAMVRGEDKLAWEIEEPTFRTTLVTHRKQLNCFLVPKAV